MLPIGVKLRSRAGGDIPVGEFIDVFHRAIARARLPGILIDVADYSHLGDRPRVLLVAHEGHLGIEAAGCGRALSFVSKRRPAGAGLDLAGTLRFALRAALELESDPPAGRELAFATDTLWVTAGDRLEPGSAEEVRRHLAMQAAPLLDALYRAPATVCPDPGADARELPRLILRWSAAPPCSELLARLERYAGAHPARPRAPR